jgi:hypothetical protein
VGDEIAIGVNVEGLLGLLIADEDWPLVARLGSVVSVQLVSNIAPEMRIKNFFIVSMAGI